MGENQFLHQKSEISLESSLQSFFFDQLIELNKKAAQPLPPEAIFYSSLVMDRFGEAQNYFEVEEGRVKEKVLGLKLLESSSLSKVRQKEELKDIGDTALFLCGFFSESLSRKITDTRYYQDLGIMAYRRLDNMIPEVYDVPSFFELVSKSFFELTLLMSLVSRKLLEQGKFQDISLIVKSPTKLKAS